MQSPLSGQISPGPLSQPHASLEGSRRCLDCHAAARAVDAGSCFRCHAALGERVAASLGLHARPDHQRCERCHAEHAGRDFELVYWGEAGRERFDHRQAGFPLAGAHASLACEKCHAPARLPAALLEARAGVSPKTTFLGLGTACRDCHADPHRGRLEPAACTECHSQSTWKPAAGFDHARTRYPLTGAHARTGCLECHRQTAPATTTVAAESTVAPLAELLLSQFRGDPSPACASCHRDVHLGRLGADCERCHGTVTFRETDSARFDHDRTAYPLAGAHRPVACAACHPAGRALRIAGFERCEACHRDAHDGQFVRAAAPRPCAACHTVDSFRPARYTPGDHQRSAFPLGGAHRAVSCAACHDSGPAPRPPAATRRSPTRAMDRFRFSSTACRECHADPHQGSLDRYVAGAGCAGCHDDASWRTARFDHERSAYPLRGKHRAVDCARCHAAGPETGPPRRAEVVASRPTAPAVYRLARLTGLPRDCASCHVDPHAGQFARGGATDCEHCHDVDGFAPARFDHQRDAVYPLDGAHSNVACAACHRREVWPGLTLVRYKPLPTHCEGCHAKDLRTRAGGAR